MPGLPDRLASRSTDSSILTYAASILTYVQLGLYPAVVVWRGRAAGGRVSGGCHVGLAESKKWYEFYLEVRVSW